jgi:hypothetical protein
MKPDESGSKTPGPHIQNMRGCQLIALVRNIFLKAQPATVPILSDPCRMQGSARRMSDRSLGQDTVALIVAGGCIYPGASACALNTPG